MDLTRKHEIATQAIDSISRHEDEDAGVRLAMLDQVIAYAQAEKEAINATVAARVRKLQAKPAEA